MKKWSSEEIEDRAFWTRKTGQERLAALEELRWRTWGAAYDAGIQRVVQIREFSDELSDDPWPAPPPGREHESTGHDEIRRHGEPAPPPGDESPG